jgi:peptidoglycan glycosyltransferase
MDLGEGKIRAMSEAFGLDGEPYEIPLRVEASGIGDIPDAAALAQTSIGQRDVRMTPLQAALVAATVANGGSQMKPYLVDQVQAPDLTVIDSTQPEKWRQPISKQVAGQLTEMMTSVVANGSGRAARIPGVQVAGKTGTAQVSPDVPDHTWFMGFAPADNPKIAVAVFVANGGGTGGERSAPIARQVIQAYLDGHGG